MRGAGCGARFRTARNSWIERGKGVSAHSPSTPRSTASSLTKTRAAPREARAALPAESSDQLDHAARVLLHAGNAVVVRIVRVGSGLNYRREIRVIEGVDEIGAELERRAAEE